MPVSEITIDATAIKPIISKNETQIILQRHCDYNRKNGGLISKSAEKQSDIVLSFINELQKTTLPEDLKNTYFLFVASDTISSQDYKRCVETTDIAMMTIKNFLSSKNISISHIVNLNPNLNYDQKVKESSHITEPKMFTDNSGYAEYLQEKHGGMNLNFWIDFETDMSKEKREELNAEGPDEIVDRGVRYIYILQRYGQYFHKKNPNSKLFIWVGTHYDLISPLVKQRVFNWDKTDDVFVEYCGGISIVSSDSNTIANINGATFPFDSQDTKQLHRHL